MLLKQHWSVIDVVITQYWSVIDNVKAILKCNWCCYRNTEV